MPRGPATGQVQGQVRSPAALRRVWRGGGGGRALEALLMFAGVLLEVFKNIFCSQAKG